MNQRKATADFYGFENTMRSMSAFAELRRRRSLAQLQLCAGYVWAREGGRGKCPIVRTIYSVDRSYFQAGVIYLLPVDWTVEVLLHEIAHALGTRDKLTHGPAFQRRCLHLYKTYGEWDGRVA